MRPARIRDRQPTSLITELRPTVLDNIGVEAAIEDLAERARRDGLEIQLAIDLGGGQHERRSPEVDTALYRITQEALTNARKHGGAQQAQIDIQACEHYLHLNVYDDGHGFDPDTRTDGFGLHSMRERAELLGGDFQLRSAPGRGTQISVDFPIRHAIRQRAS